MLRRISRLHGLGRFTKWDHPKDDALRFRRLSVVYARNASGKSTLARVLASSGASDAANLMLHQTLGPPVQPNVVLDFASGPVRFDGTQWHGNRPDIRVFDREFIEANVFVGRAPSKDQRKELLRIALGVADVEYAKKVDALAISGRAVSTELRQHDTLLSTAAAGVGLSVPEFISLQELDDSADRRLKAEEALRAAITASEVIRRPKPSLLPLPPAIDFQTLCELLSRNVQRLGDETEARVREHLQKRLQGRGESWVRQGLSLMDERSCPFCGQDVESVELIRHYRTWFDDAYERFVQSLDDAIRNIRALTLWWGNVKSLGPANALAFDAWADQICALRPQLDSQSRKSELDFVSKKLIDLLVARRDRPLEEQQPEAELDEAASIWGQLTSAFTAYNSGVVDVVASIDAKCAELSLLKVDDARRALHKIDAASRRHQPDVKHAYQERSRLELEKARIDREKADADAKMKTGAQTRLRDFSGRMNAILSELGADFKLEALKTERGGGSAGASFSLRLETGTLEVSSRDGEQKFARVLSDGDRSTLALAVFFASLQDEPAISESVVVFDDPMTSLDVGRMELTAARITMLGRSCRQVIVLSHHAPFLATMAQVWRRLADDDAKKDVAELELDRGTRAIRHWSAEEHVAHEALKRLKEVQAFVNDPGRDGLAGHIQGEVRKVLEDYVRFRTPELFISELDSLEPVIRKLKSDEELRNSTPFSRDDVDEMDRLCMFGAKGNHSNSHRIVSVAEPEAVRHHARAVLAFIRR